MHKILVPLSAGLALALAVPWGAAVATALPPLDLETVSGRAELIVTGTAVAREVIPSQDGRYPFTFVTFDVEGTLKGRAHDRRLVLRFDGGDLGNDRLTVHGRPEFVLGERYLLFVEGNGRLACPIVGWWQGQLRFAREPGTQRTLLVDHRGLPVRGIAGGRWLHAPAAGTTPRAEVLTQEGVKISPHPAVAPVEVPAADRVLAELAVFLRGRASRPGHVPGQLVESARTSDVPARVVWTARPAPPAQ